MNYFISIFGCLELLWVIHIYALQYWIYFKLMLFVDFCFPTIVGWVGPITTLVILGLDNIKLILIPPYIMAPKVKGKIYSLCFKAVEDVWEELSPYNLELVVVVFIFKL